MILWIRSWTNKYSTQHLIAEGLLAVLSRSQGGVETAGRYDRAIMDIRLLQRFSWAWPIGLAQSSYHKLDLFKTNLGGGFTMIVSSA